MQIEPMPNSDGWRCWLSLAEQDVLSDHYGEDLRRQLAIDLMLDGLRSDEVTRVRKSDVRPLDAEDEAYVLRIEKSKSGYREAPISRETKRDLYALASVPGTHQDEELLDVTTRTLQNWVREAGQNLALEESENDWTHVTPHDLRRSWATTTYYSLYQSPAAKDIVMRWGGWDDEDTFEENYLGRPPDDLAAGLMHDAGIA